jgi:mRNA interferase MazF
VTYAAFDIIVVPFPFRDRLAEKRRPAVVISKPALEVKAGRVWVAMITSAVHSKGFADVHIGDAVAAGLSVNCMVRAAKITNVDTTRVLRRVGALAHSDQAALQEALALCAAF